MLRVMAGGVSVAVELWSLSGDALLSVLLLEPPGLSVGKVSLADGTEVLGVLGEPFLCEEQKDISSFGGWRAYVADLAADRSR